MRNLCRPSLLLLLTLSACDSKSPSSSSSSTPGPVTQLVTSEFGGTVGETGGASVTVPPGALPRDARISVEPAPPEGFADASVGLAGHVWHFKVDGSDHFRFSKPVRLSLPYDPSLAPPDSPVGLVFWDDGRWQDVPGAVADPQARLVTAEVRHFTPYAPAWKKFEEALEKGRTADARRFLENEFWHGEVNITIQGGGSQRGTDPRRYTISRVAHVKFRIPRQPGEAESAAAFEMLTKNRSVKLSASEEAEIRKLASLRHWTTPFMNRTPEDESAYSLAVNDAYSGSTEDWGEGGKMGPDTHETRTLTGGDSGRGMGVHELEIDLAKGTYTLMLKGLEAGILKLVETETGKPDVKSEGKAGIAWVMKDEKLPSSGNVLTGSMEIKKADRTKYITELGSWDFPYGKVKGTITWTLSPVPLDDVELVIRPEGYDDWLPRGGENEGKKGNSIKMTALVRKKGGGATRAKIKTLNLWLSDVSKVPGVCLNHPANGVDTWDLKLSADGAKLSADGTSLTKEGDFPELTFHVDSYDWGAWGAVRGFAVLSDGRPVWATLDGHPEESEVRVPKRSESSKIADKWKKDLKAEDVGDTDDDDRQKFNNNLGDGLTLYEEYRGMIAKGKHTRDHGKGKDGLKPLTPDIKDLVVNVRIQGNAGVEKGLLLFQKESHIHIVEVDDAEIPGTRQVNVNRDPALSAGKQHGLVLMDARLPGSEIGQTPENMSLSRSREGYSKVQVDLVKIAALAERDVQLPSTVAHELAHGCSVKHHGDENPRRLVNATIDKSQGVKIYDVNEDEITDRPYTLVNPDAIAESPNESSGDVNCIMCYNHLYQWSYDGGTNSYYAVPRAPPGRIFCTSKTGTGHNARRKKLPGVFGDAVIGNCLGNMRVKDQ